MPPSRRAVTAAWLFDGTGTLRADPVLVLDGATISSVDFGVPPPDDAEVVDLGDATLLPGLVDTHVHLAFDASPAPVENLAARSDSDVLAAMRAAGRTALAGGVTTVRDLGDRDYLSLALRDEPGMPTLVCAGPPITTPAGHCHFLGGVAEPGPDGMRAAVREHAERGVDVVKVMATGGNMTPGSAQHEAQFSEEEMRAAVDEAHRLGLPVTAHAHATAGIDHAIAAGVDGLEHASFWSEEGVDDPGDRIGAIASAGIVVGATLGFVPVPGMQPPPEVALRMSAFLANQAAMHAAGVRIVAGTDAGIAPIKPHDVVRYAVPQLVGIGMTPAEALAAVTSVAADVCGLGDRKGRLAPQYDADVLAVRGNPLEDPEALHDVVAVFARGRRV